jgi:DNA-binding CsgD family transcriptional regulator
LQLARFIRCGAESLLDFHTERDCLKLLLHILNGGAHIPCEVEDAANMLSAYPIEGKLSPAECKVLAYYAEGYCPKEISKMLFRDVTYIRNLVYSIRMKLYHSTRKEIEEYALWAGLATAEDLRRAFQE